LVFAAWVVASPTIAVIVVNRRDAWTPQSGRSIDAGTRSELADYGCRAMR
jgi:hypothetical protein